MNGYTVQIVATLAWPAVIVIVVLVIRSSFKKRKP